MTEEFRLSTIRMRIDQEIQIDARGGVEEIEDASVATEITAFDRESETYYLEGAVLFSGFLRGAAELSPEQWLRSQGDVFEADKAAHNQGEVSPLYYRLPFALRVPIEAQEGPFFNVTARVGTWNLTVTGPDHARVKADLLIQGLSGNGGYEFEVGSQREARDASGLLVSGLKPETVDSPFVTYENREWLLEGHQTDEEEEVIFIRDMVTQSRSDESDPGEEADSTAEFNPVYQETRSETRDSDFETESAEQRETVDSLFPQSLSDVQYPYVTSVNLFPSQSPNESGIQTDGQIFQWQGSDLFQSNLGTQVPIPPVTLPESNVTGVPDAGWADAVGQQAEALADDFAGQLTEELSAANRTETAFTANTGLSEATEGRELSEESFEAEFGSSEVEQDVDREAIEFHPKETYQFAFPEAPVAPASGTVRVNPIQPEQPEILKSESSLSYLIRASERKQEAEPLSFAGLAGGELFGKRMVTAEQIEEALLEMEALLAEKENNADGSKSNSTETDDSIWSRFTDSDEKRYTMVFRIVQSSDTLETLAEKFSVSVMELMRENRMAQGTVEAGQLLYIPRR